MSIRYGRRLGNGWVTMPAWLLAIGAVLFMPLVAFAAVWYVLIWFAERAEDRRHEELVQEAMQEVSASDFDFNKVWVTDIRAIDLEYREGK